MVSIMLVDDLKINENDEISSKSWQTFHQKKNLYENCCIFWNSHYNHWLELSIKLQKSNLNRDVKKYYLFKCL
jgi:hypothetical protein